MSRKPMVITTLFLALLMLCSCATTEKKEDVSYVTVSASSTVNVKPDTASFSITAEAVRETTEDARNESSSMVEDAVKILKDEFGITDDEIKTEYMNISPYYEWIGGERTLSGQKASQTLTITIRNGIDRAGRVYDRLSVLDGISISSISYSRSDTSSEEAYARETAVRNAFVKAGNYADGASLTLGRVVSISEGTTDYSYSYSGNRLMMAEAAVAADSYTSTTYYAGNLSVSASVTVVFELN